MTTNRKRPYWAGIASVLSAFFFAATLSYAEGGLSLSQTRVIFEAKAKSAKVTINNQSDRVYLVSSRVLPTPEANRQVAETMPFMVTPPLFRLEKASRNTVLISKNDTSGLPTDRESVFYLSFLAIPAVKKSDAAPGESDADSTMTSTQVSFGIRTVIKLFYRPSGLAMPAAAAPEKLTFTSQGTQLTVNNPTPYYITLVQLNVNGQAVNVRDHGAMVAPFASQDYPLKGASPVNTVQWSVVNEFGGASDLFRWAR